MSVLCLTLSLSPSHCSVIDEQQYNKMSLNNLALVFGPTLIRPKPEQIM